MLDKLEASGPVLVEGSFTRNAAFCGLLAALRPGQPIHAMYATTDFWNADGQSATQWTLNWAQGVLDKAPHPQHG